MFLLRQPSQKSSAFIPFFKDVFLFLYSSNLVIYIICRDAAIIVSKLLILGSRPYFSFCNSTWVCNTCVSIFCFLLTAAMFEIYCPRTYALKASQTISNNDDPALFYHYTTSINDIFSAISGYNTY